jgi:hypothetical protein
MPYVTETLTIEKSKVDFTGFDDVAICRPKFIYFEVDGLMPNTRHFAFFDSTNVTNYINTSIATIDAFSNLGRNDPKNAAITGGLGLLLGTPAGAGVILKGGEHVLKNRFKALPKNIISKGVASQGKNILKAMVSQGTASEFKRK